jgi:DNA-binding CsgD family transcriptional regulator
MLPALVGSYILLIGAAAAASLRSLHLRRKYDRQFLRPFHQFVLLSAAYAVMNFIGEAFAPALVPAPAGGMVRLYLVVDLVTIPLLAVLFYFLLAWVVRLLDFPVTPPLKAAFAAAEALYLTAFLATFISYFIHGQTTLTIAGIIVLNGIMAGMLLVAVSLLLFTSPRGGDPDVRRTARGLGAAYAFSAAVIVASLAVHWASLLPKLGLAYAVPAGLVFLFNVPALAVLERRSKRWAPRPNPAVAGARGLEAITCEFGLSDRELEIVRLAALGLGNREIGKRLFISPKTVKNHMTNIYAKTGVRNRVRLANLLNRPEANPGTKAPGRPEE